MKEIGNAVFDVEGTRADRIPATIPAIPDIQPPLLDSCNLYSFQSDLGGGWGQNVWWMLPSNPKLPVLINTYNCMCF